MAEFQYKPNKGSLFKNQTKTEEKHADYTGVLNVNGVLYFVDGWLNDGAKGKYLSLSIKKKQKQDGAIQPDAFIEEDVLQ